MLELSIFLAAIRPHNWKQLYDSVRGATDREFEMIFVGPYDLPSEFEGIDNVRTVKDFGCPSRCYQIGLLESKGEYVVWSADDGVFTPNGCIDRAFDSLNTLPSFAKKTVSFKYYEGTKSKTANKQKANDWWRVGSHSTLRLPYVPVDHLMVMNGLISREYLIEIGGWDCRFEHLGLGSVDLGIRLQNDGAMVKLGKRFMDLTHMPGDSGDHAPINQAHSENDYPLFRKVYSEASAAGRARIDINNWKQAEERWSRRFGVET